MSEKKSIAFVFIVFLATITGCANAENLTGFSQTENPPIQIYEAPVPPQNSHDNVAPAEGMLAIDASTEPQNIPFQRIQSEPISPVPIVSQSPTPLAPKVARPVRANTMFSYNPYASVLTQYILNCNHQIEFAQAGAISNAILYFSQRYGVDFRLVASVVAVESSFRHNAISSSGAIGLGQLKPQTARWLGVMNPFDPIDNLAGTTRYISFLVNRYGGNLDKAVSAYFQGQGNVDRSGVNGACRTYLGKVNLALSRFITSN